MMETITRHKKHAQRKMNRFYAADNLVKIEVVMNPDTWRDKILKAWPRMDPPSNGRGGIAPGHHYDWVQATTVTISGSKFPKRPATFENVAIRKKSYTGSLSLRKPSFKLKFSKFNPANKRRIKKLIGTNALTLNNSKQDDTYIRQPLGYELFRQAGVPALRCNFASVKVNGEFWGGEYWEYENEVSVPECPPRDGIYVNVETITKKQFFKHQFHNAKGNLYKIFEGQIDLLPDRVAEGYWPYKGFSPFKDRKDLMLAAVEVQRYGLEGAKRVLDWDAYLRFLAMEILTNNSDGYNFNFNNCFIYNDVEAKADPEVSEGDVRFKFIPMGIDIMFPVDVRLRAEDARSLLAKLALKDDVEKEKLSNLLCDLVDQIFGQDNLQNKVFPMVNRLLTSLKSGNARMNEAGFDEVIYQICNYRKWAYEATGTELPANHATSLPGEQAGCCSIM